MQFPLSPVTPLAESDIECLLFKNRDQDHKSLISSQQEDIMGLKFIIVNFIVFLVFASLCLQTCNRSPKDDTKYPVWKVNLATASMLLFGKIWSLGRSQLGLKLVLALGQKRKRTFHHDKQHPQCVYPFHRGHLTWPTMYSRPSWTLDGSIGVLTWPRWGSCCQQWPREWKIIG